MNENNVAYQMSLRSRECLKTKDKARWLAMWAEVFARDCERASALYRRLNKYDI